MSRKSNAGFTLVELTIVLLIVGIVAGSALPRYHEALTSYRVRSVAKRIESDLKYAARAAKQKSKPLTVLFDVVSHSYEIVGLNDIDHRGVDYHFNLQDSSYQAMLVQADFTGSEQVVFDIHGQPDSSGKVVFRVGNTQYALFMSVDAQFSFAVAP